ncbi:MAG TPA: protein kinase, partial [Phycisphaerae bacterium]
MQDTAPPDEERRTRVQQLVREVVARRSAGERCSDEDLIAAHGELMPELAQALRDLAMIEEARRHAAAGTPTSTCPEPRDALSRGALIPSQVGAVQLIREIGRGGMGVVYLGHDRMLHRDVAVKFLLHAVWGSDDPCLTRFIEGARAAAAVRHPNLTMIYQVDLIQEIPYLAMEYVDGPTLADVLRRCGP